MSELFERANTTSGQTRLGEDLHLTIVRGDHGEPVACAKGDEVFFPGRNTSPTSTARKVRSCDHAIIYNEDFIVTLKMSGDVVVVKLTRLPERARVPAMI